MPRSPQSAMMCSPSVSSPACSSNSSKEQPLFTLKHVTMVCQRMLKEREEQLRGEYDKLLAAKLAGVVFKIIIMYACIKLQALFYSLYSSMTS